MGATSTCYYLITSNKNEALHTGMRESLADSYTKGLTAICTKSSDSRRCMHPNLSPRVHRQIFRNANMSHQAPRIQAPRPPASAGNNLPGRCANLANLANRSWLLCRKAATGLNLGGLVSSLGKKGYGCDGMLGSARTMPATLPMLEA